MNQDVDQIKILAIFHFIVAGIAGLFACFPIFHLLMGISMLTGSFFQGETPTDMPFPFSMFGLMFTIIPAVMIFFGWAFAIALAISGYFLTKKQHYLFCMIMAGVSCIFTPFGTVLGVFTIVVLMRPSVKELFHYAVPATQS
jgi:hypothetical protein